MEHKRKSIGDIGQQIYDIMNMKYFLSQNKLSKFDGIAEGEMCQ
jgi:hypothetical protein